MHERIQKLRKALGLTQQEFSDKLNISRANIAGYETGRREPSDAAISLMCREFNVEEAWLREGTGNMFVDLSRNDELSVFFADLIDSDDEFKQRFIMAIAKLDSSWWRMLEKAAREATERFPAESK
jgi:transcriptional regulator with XRE-family HTH domain